MQTNTWRAIAIAAACCLALTAGALLLQAQTSLSNLWVRFPDGTIQTTAAHNCFNPTDPNDEMIRVGGVCIDKYEASVWSEPDGGIQYGIVSDNYPCSDSGQDCFGKIYARSVQGEQPSRFITWFQAQQALANAGKRLPSNANWQMAVAGTPDHVGSCNTASGSIQNTGANPGCVSAWGASDMVGNLAEWVADWVPLSNACPDWDTFSDDAMCLAGAETTVPAPGALLRGGASDNDSAAGPFWVTDIQPYVVDARLGFRGAR